MGNILGEVREHASTCPRWVGAYLRHAGPLLIDLLPVGLMLWLWGTQADVTLL